MIINGKTVEPIEMTFNTICALEEIGTPVSTWSSRDMSMLRAWLAVCMGVSAEAAGREIEAHVVGGGSLHELRESLIRAMEESDFFAALRAKNAPDSLSE